MAAGGSNFHILFNTGKPIGRDRINESAKLLAKHAGLENAERVRGHSGRKTVGSRILKGTTGILSDKSMQAAGGWNSKDSMRAYDQVTAEDQFVRQVAIESGRTAAVEAMAVVDPAR